MAISCSEVLSLRAGYLDMCSTLKARPGLRFSDIFEVLEESFDPENESQLVSTSTEKKATENTKRSIRIQVTRKKKLPRSMRY